nr:Npc1 [Starmerella bombicola]
MVALSLKHSLPWLFLGSSSFASAQCVINGNCGPVSRFGSDLPCSTYSDPVHMLDDDAQAILLQMCGPEIANNPVCCTADQVHDLASNLKRTEPLIGSCEACQQNFFDVFCQFTCSPHQAEWVDIVLNQTTLSGETAPKEVNYYLDRGLASQFYNSCSSVKFSATNGRAMDLIGGGAKSYPEFLKFLGDEKPMLGGSVFQINFPWEESSHARQNESIGYSCAEGVKKCSCIDCEGACPPFDDDLKDKLGSHCTLGPFRCVSLALILSYSVFAASLLSLWVQARRSQRRQSSREIQRLIEDDEHNEDDPFAVPSSELGSLNLRSYRLNTWVSSLLRRQGLFCANYPSLVVLLCSLFVLCSSLGLVGMQLETDPVNLWVAPNSREALERSHFNTNFGGFYRTSQLFVVNETGGPVLGDSYEVMDWLKSVERRIADLQTPVLWDSLDSFCLKPIGDTCVVESVTQYGVGNTPTWRQKLERCTKQPVNCLPKFQQPIEPNLVFGVRHSENQETSTSYLDSPALVVTWVLQNSEDPVYLHRVEEWELSVEKFMKSTVSKEAEKLDLRVSFNVESSLERELSKTGQTDAKIVVASYILMFAYVSFSLGDSIWLGVVGIAVVLASVTSAVGLLSAMGLHLTLIITEVIPFLALAIGVDNIFLIVHQVALVSELNPGLFTVEDHIANAVSSIGPSIVLSTSCEVAALAIATLVQMPAVRNFAIFAAVAVLINSVLQLTLFVSLLTMHTHRENRRREQENDQAWDWNANTSVLAGPRTNAGQEQAAARNDISMNANGGETGNASASGINISQSRSPPQVGNYTNGTHRTEDLSNQIDKRRFSFVISTEYTPFVLGRRVAQIVGCLFLLWFAISLYMLPKLTLGLDQRLAVPRDSFLVPYFSDVYEYLGVGPPVYFVVTSEGVETRGMQQKLCSRFSTCETNSLTNVLESERKRPEVSWLATASASWIDDFLMWLNPSLDTCCVDGTTHNTCYADKPWGFDMHGFPEGSNFTDYLGKWLEQPSDQCPLAGKAPYGQSIKLETEAPNGKGEVVASYFRTNHVPLRSQSDYIKAYTASRAIAEKIGENLNIAVYPYSVFYPFFAQYTSIVKNTLQLVGSAIAVTGMLSWILLGNARTAAIVTGVVISLVVDVCGLMYISGVSLNALSLVNLVICVGIGVEFCIHIARSFTFVPRVRAFGIRGFTKVDRAYNSLAGTGGTVFGGVALTKLLGVSVLAFAHSQIFNVYYFRMWFALVITASLHSLVLLPVLLSLWGGSAWLVEAENSGFSDLEEL